eukprot:358273-Chlamydomonas_euryale.AAC.9
MSKYGVLEPRVCVDEPLCGLGKSVRPVQQLAAFSSPQLAGPPCAAAGSFFIPTAGRSALCSSWHLFHPHSWQVRRV